MNIRLRGSSTAVNWAALLVALGACGAALAPRALAQDVDAAVEHYRHRQSQRATATPGAAAAGKIERVPVVELNEPRVRAADGQGPPRAALLSGPNVASTPAPDRVLHLIPDPIEAPAVLHARLEEIRSTSAREPRVIYAYEKVTQYALEYLQTITRPTQVRLSLEECIRRALGHSYAVQMESYTPAIARTRLVEAEAAFDAVFYLDTTWFNADQPTASQLQGSASEQISYGGGIRQLLPTGMQVQVGLTQNRSETDLSFQTLNPAYETSFTVSMTQPLLRNFGLDFNRSQINLRRADQRIGYEQYVQQVRETLLEVERAYWQLVQARRTAAVFAETTAQNRTTYESIQARLDHDATQVELNNSLSRFEQRKVQFLEAKNNIRIAEDTLLNLMNDPELLLTAELEIIPTDAPLVTPLTVDQFESVRTAVDNRSEIRQQRERIEQTRVQTAVAKNQLLPQLNATFNYEVNGLGGSGDDSFDQMTQNRFETYTVGVQFEIPIGNRGARAGYRGARMQESQAVLALRRITDGIVQEVNTAVRNLRLRFEQVPSSYDAAIAADANLRSLQARTQSISPSFLETELGAVENSATQRRNLLAIVVAYNTTIAELERAKGTLLEYNNVVLTDAPHER